MMPSRERPTQSPPSTETAATASSRPTEMPSGRAEDATSAGEATMPSLSPGALANAMTSSASGDSKPVINPPSNVAAATGSGVTAWQQDKRVTALWTINQTRNAWVYINGVGWRRLANNSDSAIVALNVLMSHARQTGTRVDYNEGDDGMIDQAYVW